MGAQREKQAVIFGAGNVGRGFLGHLLSLSGYQLTFVDIDRALIEAINRRNGYTLRLAGCERVQTLHIGPARGIHAEDQAAVVRAIVAADLAVTAVGARALPILAQQLAAGLTRRARTRPHAPLNILICENLKDADRIFADLIRQHLPPTEHEYLDRCVGLVMCIIARMVTAPPPEERAADPTLIVAEPYQRLLADRHGFVGPLPEIVGLVPLDRFPAWVERKLYVHNAGHAVLAYLGYRLGYAYGYEAMDDPLVEQWVRQAMRESARALQAEHGFDPGELAAEIDDLLRRFRNRALGDPITRLARDPLRKLAPTDRLVGAATLCLRHEVTPDGLAWGIAAALTYDEPSDPQAVALQERLRAEGLDPVLADVCGLDPDGALARLVRPRYQRLRAGEMPPLPASEVER